MLRIWCFDGIFFDEVFVTWWWTFLCSMASVPECFVLRWQMFRSIQWLYWSIYKFNPQRRTNNLDRLWTFLFTVKLSEIYAIKHRLCNFKICFLTVSFLYASVHCLVLEPKYLKFGTIPRHWLVINRPFQNCISHWYATNIIEVEVISIGTDQFGWNYGRRKLKTSLKRRRRSIDYKRKIFRITNHGSIKQTSIIVAVITAAAQISNEQKQQLKALLPNIYSS